MELNDGTGIEAGNTSRVANNVVTNNDVGLALDWHALADGNIVTTGTTNGVAIELSGVGIFLPGLRENYVTGPINGSGFDMGGNVCSGSTSCP